MENYIVREQESFGFDNEVIFVYYLGFYAHDKENTVILCNFKVGDVFIRDNFLIQDNFFRDYVNEACNVHVQRKDYIKNKNLVHKSKNKEERKRKEIFSLIF